MTKLRVRDIVFTIPSAHEPTLAPNCKSVVTTEPFRRFLGQERIEGENLGMILCMEYVVQTNTNTSTRQAGNNMTSLQ